MCAVTNRVILFRPLVDTLWNRETFVTENTRWARFIFFMIPKEYLPMTPSIHNNVSVYKLKSNNFACRQVGLPVKWCMNQTEYWCHRKHLSYFAYRILKSLSYFLFSTKDCSADGWSLVLAERAPACGIARGIGEGNAARCMLWTMEFKYNEGSLSI